MGGREPRHTADETFRADAPCFVRKCYQDLYRRIIVGFHGFDLIHRHLDLELSANRVFDSHRIVETLLDADRCPASTVEFYHLSKVKGLTIHANLIEVVRLEFCKRNLGVLNLHGITVGYGD